MALLNLRRFEVAGPTANNWAAILRTIEQHVNANSVNIGTIPSNQITDNPGTATTKNNTPLPAPSQSTGQVAYNSTAKAYTLILSAPSSVTPASSNQLLSAVRSGQLNQQAAIPVYHVQVSADPQFGSILQDFTIGVQHVFTYPSSNANLFFRWSSSNDGVTFNSFSPPAPASVINT